MRVLIDTDVLIDVALKRAGFFEDSSQILPMADLEDAMQAAAANSFKASWVITRNVGDYKKSSVPAISPSEFLKTLAATE